MAGKADVVLQELVARRAITRSELAEASASSRSYVVRVTDALLRQEVLADLPGPSGQRGRPSSQLAWGPRQPLFATAQVESGTVRVGWFRPGTGYDGASDIWMSHRGGVTVSTALMDGVEQLCGRSPSLRPQGIGVAIPGIVDASRGLVVQALRLNLRNVLLGSIVEEHFALPVRVDRAARAAAFGESMLRGDPDLFFVDTGDGVGGAAVHDGRTLDGFHHASGEIGHLVVNPGGDRCTCGKRGCLETVISRAGLARRFRLSGDAAGLPALPPAAQRDVARWLHVALAHIAVLLDPNSIVLGPTLRRWHGGLAQVLNESLSQMTLPENRVEVSWCRSEAPALEGVGMHLALTWLGQMIR